MEYPEETYTDIGDANSVEIYRLPYIEIEPGTCCCMATVLRNDGWMDGRMMDGRMDEWMDRWTGGWMEPFRWFPQGN